MNSFDLFAVIALVILAFGDLMVGVANDAVNFLNPAIGAKAAKLKTILLVSSVGMIIGATFSDGIIEVARKGIFNPDFFTAHEAILIFTAVAITDIILLDLLLPGLNGYEVLQKIRDSGETKALPVIVFSNLGQREDIEKAKAIGVNDFLIKANFTLDDVVTKVASFLK